MPPKIGPTRFPSGSMPEPFLFQGIGREILAGHLKHDDTKVRTEREEPTEPYSCPGFWLCAAIRIPND